MKNKLNIFYLIALSLFIYSCSNNNRPIGKWDDIIKLSTKDVTFKSTSDSITITTEGDWWWITGITVNNEHFAVPENINFESDNYVINQDCFTVEKKDKNTLYIELDENQTSIERIVVVELEAGDYFDRVKITQSAN